MRTAIKHANRRFLRAAIVLIAGPGFAACPAIASSQPAALPFELTMIAPGVYSAIDGPGGKSGSNAGFVIGDDGVLVVDSFFDPEATRALIAEIRKLTPKPIRYVVNTHYHIDHVGGDAVLQQAGAVVIAHRNVRGWVRTENLHLFGDRITPAMKDRVAALALPDLTTDKDLTVWLGQRKVVVRTVHGHTGGDLVVSVPDADVVFCGDIVWRHVSPNIIDGTVATWIQTVRGLGSGPQAAQTTFVPGHGGIATAKDLADFADYLDDLRAIVRSAHAKGLSGDALVQAAMPELTRKHGDWTAFAHFAPLELRFMADELAGRKRTPQPVGE
ncbi:MBL fold metallo-hydrolase [Novosphingobium sp.]|uniref:MBL fold metallo-hydrolase n=1 Tax=Novosphingobium sp. TaxID=1874826 RepID=UPI0025FBB1DA|nr:MBL fold metallo-hydrolase [Novosphingobium sp.]